MRFRVALMVVALCTVPMWGRAQIFADDFEFGSPNGWTGIQGWAPAAVGATGQVTCYAAAGTVIPCADTGQDGDLRPGMVWPLPRFVDNGDGTVTDNLTELVWLKNANCYDDPGWNQALVDANTLASGACGLADGSVAGDWHLPSVNELQSLVDYEYANPALSNAAGTGRWSEGDAFSGVQSFIYWSSSSYANLPSKAWCVVLQDGVVFLYNKTSGYGVWPVRGRL